MCSPSLLKSERCQTLGKSHIKIFPTTTPTFCSFFTAPPIFLVEPSNQKVAEGAPASFDCIAGIFLQFYSNKKSTWIQIQILFSQFYDIFCLFFVFQLEIQHQPCFGLKNPAQAFICPLPHMAMWQSHPRERLESVRIYV